MELILWLLLLLWLFLPLFLAGFLSPKREGVLLNKIKQNKNSSVIFRGRIASLFLSCILLFSFVLSFPVFADSSGSLPLVSSSPSVSEIVSLSFPGWIEDSKTIFCAAFSSSSSPVLGGCVSGNTYCFASIDPFTLFYCISSDSSPKHTSVTSFNGTYLVYLDNYTTNTRSNLLPTYSSLSDFTDFVKTFSSSSGSAVVIPSTRSLVLGTTSNGSVVSVRASYENDAAVIFDSSELSNLGGYIINVVSLHDYGVILDVSGTESAMMSNEIVFDGTTYYSKYTSTLVLNPSETIGIAPNSSQADQACIDALNLATPSPGTKNLSYSLPAGNMIFLKLTDRSDLAQLLATFSTSSGSSPLWSQYNIRYGFADSIPSDFSSLPDSSWYLVPWSASGASSLLGIRQQGIYDLDLSGHSGQYFVVYNPLWGSAYSSPIDTTSGTLENPSVTISCSGISESRVFGLDSRYNSTTGVIDTDANGSYWDLDVNNPTNTWTDSNGNISSPVTGGGSNANPVSNFWSWLNGKFDELKNLFATGHNTIQTLVGYGSDFMTSISNLYAWLPGPVYSVLCSCLILVLIVGVVKVFL